MKSIIFRGQKTDGSGWAYGYYCRNGYTDKEQDLIIPTYASALYGLEVEFKTVGQHTGLYDHGGAGIYEGDLLSYNCGDGDTELREVLFLNGRFVTQMVYSGTIDESPYQTIKLAKVVGNIYDNPDFKPVEAPLEHQ